MKHVVVSESPGSHLCQVVNPRKALRGQSYSENVSHVLCEVSHLISPRRCGDIPAENVSHVLCEVSHLISPDASVWGYPGGLSRDDSAMQS